MTGRLWLVKWCKIHKDYIHSHSMFLLIFTNIFVRIQQPNLHSRNILIHIYLCIFYSRLYLLTFTRCLHSHSTSYIYSHSRSKYSFNIFCAPPLRIGQYKTWTADYGLRTTDYGLRTTDYGLRTTDWVKHGLRYKRRTKHYGLGIKYRLKYKTRTVRYGLGYKTRRKVLQVE